MVIVHIVTFWCLDFNLKNKQGLISRFWIKEIVLLSHLEIVKDVTKEILRWSVIKTR